MADPRIERRDFYVYALFRGDFMTPFYIGKGRQNRWLIHERDAHKGKARKDRIIQSMRRYGWKTIPKIKLATNLTDREAKEIEIRLIAAIGRLPHGPLANYTRGGDGMEDPPDEVRKKQTEANIRSWANPEVRAKRSEGMKAVWTPEKRAQHAKLMIQIMADKKAMNPPKPPKEPKTRKHSDERREAARERTKKWWANPDNRERGSAAIKKAQNRPDRVAHRREIMLDPTLRTKLDAGNAQPEIRERRIAAQKAAFASPEAKAKRSAISLDIWKKRKLLRQKTDPSAHAHESHPIQS